MLEQWAVKPLKSCVRLKFLAARPMKYGANEAALDDDQNQPRFIRITDITEDGSLRADTFKSLPPDMAQDYMLDDGDLLFARSGATVGKTFIYHKSWGPACFAGYLIQFRCNQARLLPRFLFYFTQGSDYWSQIGVSTIQATIQNVSAEKYGDVVLPVPPIPVQQAITEYLDRETPRLDGLILAKERVLRLLAEKRQALITRAVTRGMDSRAPLRDSGIPWLGEIPAHWEIEKARWLFRERDERSDTGEEELLTVSHLTGVTPRSEKDVNMFEAETNEGYKICFAGDLVINTLWAWMGAMGVSCAKGIVSPAYNVYHLGPRLDRNFIDALVRIPVFAQEVIRYSKGVWSSRLRLYPEGFFEVFFPVPPINEQRAIAAYITVETAKLDALRAATERTISLLKERRAALIAASVTGKLPIDMARFDHGDKNEVS
jgi:type I restriction enzyme S subunit